MDEKDKKEYNKYVESVTPTHSLPLQMLKAFLTGGLICTLGQVIYNLSTTYLQLDQTGAGSVTSLTLILISVILTALGIYPVITKYGGAGSLVPITGFANSVSAPAIEFKKEGQVYGIGCQIFKIAGPVILYGILSSSGLGLLYWICKQF